MSYLFIDPSIESMGIAFWTNSSWKTSPSHEPSGTKLFVSHGKDWLSKANHQLSQLENFLRSDDYAYDPFAQSRAYCEMPTFFHTGRGMVAAESGSLLKLTYFVGQLSEMFRGLGFPFELVSIQQWKGQLPKKVVQYRIIKTLGPIHCSQFRADIWDAVGIGLWKKGVL